MRLSRLQVGLVLVVACAPSHRDGIDGLFAVAPTIWRDSASALNRAARDSGLVLSVWPRNDSIAIDSTRFAIHEHPCGIILRARFRSVPARDAVIDPERIIEFDSAGALVREWRAPTDEIPLAVQDDELFISYQDSLLLGLRLDGTYRVVPKVTLPDWEQLACPTPRLFSQSGYERCALLADIRTGVLDALLTKGPARKDLRGERPGRSLTK